MIHALREFYGLQATPPGDLFQFFVWEILSEQALSARRDLAWQALKRIPALTPDAMSRAPKQVLLEAVGIAGPHREEKVEGLYATVGEFKRHRDALDIDTLRHGSRFSAARALGRLAHIHPAVRARAHLFALDSLVLPVDHDINRVVSRLMGVPQNRNRGKARRWLSEQLPAELAPFREAVVYLRHHALHTCLRVGPHCAVCPLRDRCPHASSTPRPDA